MRQTFKNKISGVVRSFEVINDKVITTIKIDNAWISNPTLDKFYQEWENWIVPVPELYVPTYAELVEQYIREHGYPTYGAELAVLNNYAESPAEYLGAWQTYMGVRHDAKEWAEQQPHREEESV